MIPRSLIRPTCLIALTYCWAITAQVGCVHADPLPVTPLYQNDPRWENEKIDNSSSTIGEFGCTLTCWTMLINYEIGKADIKDKDGKPISYTPSEINTLLNDYRYKDPNDNKTYNGWSVLIDAAGKPQGSDTDQNIGAIKKAVEADTKKRSGQGLVLDKLSSNKSPDGVKVPAEGTVVDEDFKPLKTAIDNKDPVVVRVNGKDKEGNPVADGHSVLVIGWDDTNGWVIIDPFDVDETDRIIFLNHPDYQNRIFRYDFGVFKAGGKSTPYSVPSPYYIDELDLYDPIINPDQYGPYSEMKNLGKINGIPEPSTLVMAATGLLLLLHRSRRVSKSG
jgi:hypothetical protein